MLNIQLLLDIKEHFAKENPLLEAVHIEGTDFSQFNLVDFRARTYGTSRVSHIIQIYSARNNTYHKELVATAIKDLTKAS